MGAFEGPQVVLADPAHVDLSHDIRHGWQGPQGGAIDHGTLADDLPIGSVDLGRSDRQQGQERGIALSDAAEGAAGRDVGSGDVVVAFDAALAGRPVRGQHVDVEPVVPGERDRLRVQLHGPGRRAGGRSSGCGHRRLRSGPHRSARTLCGGTPTR